MSDTLREDARGVRDRNKIRQLQTKAHTHMVTLSGASGVAAGGVGSAISDDDGMTGEATAIFISRHGDKCGASAEVEF